MTTARVALAHDYVTQRGGAERVVLALARAFPGAPLYTSLYEPETTFPEFSGLDIRPLPLNNLAPLRTHHRWSLPLLAPAFSRLKLDEGTDVVVCSSSGWAHAINVDARKVVYCHTPARWLYQSERYLGTSGTAARVARATLRFPLERWDRRGAASAHRYLANSSWIARQIKDIYGIEAEVLHPPVTVVPDGEQQPVAGLEPGFGLCVSRLLPYKNVEAVMEAYASLPSERLVVVGTGPQEAELKPGAGGNVRLAGGVSDGELRWLYARCDYLIAASYEDFGLTPIEAAAFGKPTAALRFGGFLDTVREGETGAFFDSPAPGAIARAVGAIRETSWNPGAIRGHAATFSEQRFARRMRQVVADELRKSTMAPATHTDYAAARRRASVRPAARPDRDRDRSEHQADVLPE